MKRKRKRKGFTLVELVIAIAVVALIGGVSASIFFSGDRRYIRAIEIGADELSLVMRDTRGRSVTQEGGAPWGIRFIHNMAGSDQYEVFSGASYDMGTVVRTHTLSNRVELEGVGNEHGDYTDVVFTPVEGRLDSSRVVSINSSGKKGVLGDVTTYSLGRVVPKPVEDGVIMYLHFDEAVGVADPMFSPNVYFLKDSSGYAHNSGGRGGALWKAEALCKAGTCLSFDMFNPGPANPIFNNDPASVKTFTIEGWVRPSDVMPMGFRSFASTNDGYGFEAFDTGLNGLFPEFHLSGEPFPLSTFGSITADAWHHLAFVYDGQYRRIYVNGLEDAVDPMPVSLPPDHDFLLNFFNVGNSNSGYFDGLIDEVRMYDRALSPGEIARHYDDLR
jgi:prepilin-type N-terminal cleavage/methylation domain-containing protein